MFHRSPSVIGSEVKLRAPGLVVVLSAPSGAGKSTLSATLMSRLPRMRYSISCTTRPPRPGEEPGKDYYFVGEDEFKSKENNGEFLETAFVHNHWYGTPKKSIEENRLRGLHTLLAIDVQGGKRVKQAYPDSVLVFLAPPALMDLKERLQKRRKDAPDAMVRRLQTAKEELQQMDFYDYLVINADIREAAADLEAIVAAEERRIVRLKSQPDFAEFKNKLREEII